LRAAGFEDGADDATATPGLAAGFAIIQPKLFAIMYLDGARDGGLNCFQHARLLLLRQHHC
jgi:hypothetical protein